MSALLAVGFVLMWSSGFVGAVLGTASAGSETLLAWRFLIVVLVLGAWWALTRRRRLPAREVAVHALVGLLSQGVYLSGVVWSAELGVPAGIAALIAALQPIAAAALAGPLLGERTSASQWLGLVLGLGGVALVVAGDLARPGAAPALAYALPFLAMAGLVAATFTERRLPSELPLGDSLLIQSGASAVVFTAVAALTGGLTPPTDGSFWFAVAWVVVLSTFGGYGFYWLNVRRGSVTRASTLLYLTPPTTMVLAFVMFGEQVTAGGLLGLGVCVVAVLLVLRSPRSPRSPREMSAPGEMMAACSSTTSSAPPRT
ncbi:DMT family transporter [Prauserella endophytica]|uniref:DMT family transporter n=1 Tax=Prauserella endophytica TaxID=1592324 RepID=A0ABY2RUS8_9PSEU|nr:DMT family transporter [Prauserella endophytica]TKG61339.1 DMT family transporter [Prauserella endophytica]